MSSVHQYFDTDFDYALRVRVALTNSALPCEAAIFYDANASAAFLAFYFTDPTLQPVHFERFLGGIKPGMVQVSLAGEMRLPAGKTFHGQLQVHNSDPFKIQYQLFGDPSWRELMKIVPTRRVFLYADTAFSSDQIRQIQDFAELQGHDVQVRDMTYAKERTLLEKPLAFISHDSRDKETIARPMALNLQRKVCPVWYDEYTLKLGLPSTPK